MAEPTEKHPRLEAMLSRIAGRSRVDTIRADLCMMCTCDAKEFKDEESFQEYRNSGMCQHCQDAVFGVEAPDPRPLPPLPPMNPPI